MSNTDTAGNLTPGYYYYYKQKPLGFYVGNIDGPNGVIYQRFSKRNPRIPGRHRYNHKSLAPNVKLTQVSPVTDSEGDSDRENLQAYLGGRKSRNKRNKRNKRKSQKK